MTAKEITKQQAWIQATRPRTLPLALASIAMGGFLAAEKGLLSWPILILSGLTMAAMQILSNLANDYGDTVHGADSDQRVGPQRVTQLGLISKAEMIRAMLFSAGLAILFGLAALWVTFGLRQMIWVLLFAGLGGAGIWAAIAYTATANPYGYLGLGDLFVLLFFGWIPSIGTYFLQARIADLATILPATAVGLLAVAVLNVNNMRDIDSDRLAGKRSIPVRIGFERAKQYHWGLLIIAWMAALLYGLLRFTFWGQWALFALTLPLLLRNGLAVTGRPQNELDPMLKRTVLTTVLFVVVVGIAMLIG